MTALGKVWVFAEAHDGRVAPVVLEALAKARELGGEVEAFFGGGGDEVAATLGAHGASCVYATGDLGGALAGVSVAAAMAAEVGRGNRPDLVLFGTTYDGRDVAARLSVALDRPVLTNNVDVTFDADGSGVEGAGSLVTSEPVFGGAVVVRTRFTAPPPHLVLVRPKSFTAADVGGDPAEVVAVAVPDTGAAGAARVTGRHVEEAAGPKLDEAAVVVAGGRGLGEAAKYEMVEKLARLLQGAPAATRAIVDAGWVPYSHQVGQTGKVVKPMLYLAVGISGATQHMVGMKGAKHIIAVNKDADAPILSIADLGVVGDLHKVLPKLIAALEARPT